MPLATNGFQPGELADHWQKHHHEFEPPPLAQSDYELNADAFLTGPLRPTMIECTRANGDICRYDTATDEYGVLGGSRLLLTYFKPNPKKHGHPTNEAYFHSRC